MSESLAFKERPSLGHGFYLLLIETDYKTSLSRVESLSEATKTDLFENKMYFLSLPSGPISVITYLSTPRYYCVFNLSII